MTKIRTYITIALASAALIGLVYIQVNWLQSGLLLQKKLFKERAFTSLNVLHDKFDKQHELIKELTQIITISDQRKQAPSKLLLREAQNKLTHLIDSLLKEHHIDTKYECYVFNSKTGKIYLSNVPIKYKQVSKKTFGSYRVCAGNQLQNIFNDTSCYGAFQIGVLFPEQDRYLLRGLRTQLLLSLFFIVLLLACFVYTIRTILKQRKLSVIKNDFINNLTHELKTPIFSISLVTKVFRENIAQQRYSKAPKYLDLIETENEQLKNHVEKVLQLALMENKEFELDLQKVNLHALIEKTVQMFEFLAQQKNGNIVLSLQARNSDLAVDETHLSSVLHSLLDNALKYTRATPQIEIITEDKEGGLFLSIRDNGIGIKPKDQPYIFEKFYRVSTGNVHNVKGFGLGLSYVKMIIEAHKGMIRLNSQWKQGTEFQIFLPYKSN